MNAQLSQNKLTLTSDIFEKIAPWGSPQWKWYVNDNMKMVLTVFLKLPEAVRTQANFSELCSQVDYLEKNSNADAYPWAWLPAHLMKQDLFDRFIAQITETPDASVMKVNTLLGVRHFELQATDGKAPPFHVDPTPVSTAKNAFREFTIEKSQEMNKADFELDNVKKLEIILTKDIDPKTLPYQKEINIHLQAYNEEAFDAPMERLNQCVVLARGESAPPHVIFDQGGFHPKSSTSERYVANEDMFNFRGHRSGIEETGFGTALVSLTPNIYTAKKFAGDAGFVYLTKATGPISPFPNSEGLYKECEYSLPGGVDAEDIIAYRQLGDNRHNFDGSSIFIQEAFIQKYPNQVAELISFYLQPNEVYRTENAAYVSKSSCEVMVSKPTLISSSSSSSSKDEIKPKDEASPQAVFLQSADAAALAAMQKAEVYVQKYPKRSIFHSNQPLAKMLQAKVTALRSEIAKGDVTDPLLKAYGDFLKCFCEATQKKGYLKKELDSVADGVISSMRIILDGKGENNLNAKNMLDFVPMIENSHPQSSPKNRVT